MTPGVAWILLLCLVWIVIRELIGLSTATLTGPRWDSLVRRGVALAPAILVALLTAFLSCYLWTILAMDSGQALLFSARALDLTSTLGPVVPFAMTTLVLILWATSGLQRAFLLAVQGDPRSPFPACPSLAGIAPLYSDVASIVVSPFARLVALAVPLVVLVPFHRTVSQAYTTVDGRAWSLLFQVLLLSCYFVTVYSFSLFVLIWVRLSRLLRRLSQHPLSDAFRRLPESCTATPWKLWRTVPNLTILSASVAQLRVVVNLGKGHLNPTVWDPLKTFADTAEAHMASTFAQSATSVPAAVDGQLEVRKDLRQAVTAITAPLEDAWSISLCSRDPLEKLATPGLPARDQETATWLRLTAPTNFCLWDRAAEELVVLRITAFIRLIFQHLRNLLGFVFMGIVLMLAAISSYPFQPKNSVMALSWFVVLATVGVITWIFVGMERDPVLSNMGKTDPGKVTLNREFLTSLVIYVFVPLLTLLATQFPGVGDVVFSVFNPAMKSLSH